MTPGALAQIIVNELDVGLVGDDDNPVFVASPTAGGDEDGDVLSGLPPEVTEYEVSLLRKALERFGNKACDVYCRRKSGPKAELVQEVGKVFLAAIAAEVGAKPDTLAVTLGTACAVFFLKTGMDKACAC